MTRVTAALCRSATWHCGTLLLLHTTTTLLRAGVHTAQGPPAARVVIWADVEAAAKKAVGADVAARVS